VKQEDLKISKNRGKMGRCRNKGQILSCSQSHYRAKTKLQVC